MSKKRRQHNPELKAKVGLEALKGIEAVHAIAAKYQVHPVQVSQWKKEVAERLPEVFSRKTDPELAEAKAREDELYRVASGIGAVAQIRAKATKFPIMACKLLYCRIL